MNPSQATLVAGDASWMLVSASLVLLMTPALALFYGGMSSRRSVLNMMMSFIALGVVSVVYVLWGWSESPRVLCHRPRGFHRRGRAGVKLLAVQAVIALASVLVSGVLTFLIAVVIKKTIGWRITEQEEFEGIDYSIHRETGYDVGGPGHHRHRGPGPWSAAGER